ncbi:phosphoribosylglycinamide formyltransferase [Aliiglaciecola sp. M165]|uniref:phosphoribosylglycinamide formyltransferase n=1 Tax=Aliiglaciecola sp. M165 TaxID=2593649 RepID=UPI00117ED7ED|nr:phosphoribosylglycinamide formyltransferase [Aliiglaciecola sp. M165]TRY30190.1 phosphoribosylglycinamide formyltransferase [Aliiglaciecola sp. M165]
MSSPSRIVVLVSGNGSNLQAIIDYFENRSHVAQVVGVISNVPDVFALERAKVSNIPSVCLNHKDYDNRETYDIALKNKIDEYAPDLLVLAGFMRILTEDFVRAFEGKMLNIHPSLLPKYKGLNTHQKAIDAGDKEHGASVHFVTPELDGGPVIIQSKVPVFIEDNASVLAQRVQQQERNVYPLVVDWFCNERLVMINNKAVLDGNELPQSGYAAD